VIIFSLNKILARVTIIVEIAHPEPQVVTILRLTQWCIGGYTLVYAVYQPPGFFGQRILTSVIINKQGTFRPFATPLCIYPPPFLAIHH